MPDPIFVELAKPPRRVSEEVPLLVLLHGIGADEQDLMPLARFLDPRLHVVSLRAPRPYVVGHAWFPIEFRADGSVVPDVSAGRATLADLTQWVVAAPARFGTDPTRTFLLGFSQGAMMSLGVLLTVPERLAGVIALSGRYAPSLFERTASDEAIARVPLLVAHGTQDDVLPIEHGRGVRDAFQNRVADFTYREFSIGHGIAPEELEIVANWLAQHIDVKR